MKQPEPIHKSPIDPKRDRPVRPARSIREIRRRRRGKPDQSILSRIFYALLTGLMYAFAGFLLDLGIAVGRSMFGVGDGDIYWLFTPFLLVIGLIIGFLDGKNAGADSMDALQITQNADADDLSIRHDLFRGLGIGIAIFAIFWFVMMLMT